MNTVPADASASANMAKIVYILYLLGLLTGLTSSWAWSWPMFIEDEAPEWVQTHYKFQIRMFWIMLCSSVFPRSCA